MVEPTSHEGCQDESVIEGNDPVSEFLEGFVALAEHQNDIACLGGGRAVVGTINGTKIRSDEVQQARNDLDLIREVGDEIAA